MFVSLQLTTNEQIHLHVIETHFHYWCKQEAQLMLTNPHDVLRGQSRSPNMAPFDMLGVVSY